MSIASVVASRAPIVMRKAPRGTLPRIALVILLLMLVCTVFAPLIAPSSPTLINIAKANVPPFHSLSSPLGTDTLGRDILSRLIYGARSAVEVAFLGLVCSAVLGTLVGVIAGYSGTRIDATLMRIVDVTLAFPTILTALVVALFLGSGLETLIVAITVTMWAQFARMVRGNVRELRSRDFVTLAVIAGVGRRRIVSRHILPNISNTIVVLASLLVSQIILLEASLSFLGLGFPPGTPAWGVMVSDGQTVLITDWWEATFPGIAIAVAVLAMNILGDWLRDATDPRRIT
jgi:peptide/nickel transport system permease protein